MSDFPKFYEHKQNDKLPNRVANTPADAVNLEARGYTAVETKAAQKTADETVKTEAKPEAKKAAESKPSN